jgi:hypothetical protein
MYVWMCADPAVCQGKFRDANFMYMQMWCKLIDVRDDAWLHDGLSIAIMYVWICGSMDGGWMGGWICCVTKRRG